MIVELGGRVLVVESVEEVEERDKAQEPEELV